MPSAGKPPLSLGMYVLDFADALAVDRFVPVAHDWGARTAYSVAVLAPKRLVGLVTLSTPYLMFQGKRESPAQVRAYWYQWYFNTERGRQAFEADPIPFCKYLWPTWSPEWKFTLAELDTTRSAWSNPQFVPFVISYYRHRVVVDNELQEMETGAVRSCNPFANK
jgi:pimeloyl-ACP methyl ester carboxylesterase